MCVAVCLVRLPLVVKEALQTLQLNAFSPATAETGSEHVRYLKTARDQSKDALSKLQDRGACTRRGPQVLGIEGPSRRLF